MDVKEYAKKLAVDLKKGRDKREKKPFILFCESDFTKYISLSSSWILSLGNHQIHLIQPNDIALYSNITEAEILRAKAFYSEKILPYVTHTSGGLIPVIPDSESLYLDYFESIIKAVIFSFTSLETFSNICLPYDYEFTDPNGKKFNREKIERYKPLEYKLEYVLTDILQSGNPTKETWWPTFQKLKDIRDQIIHSKPSKAEERYALFLSPDIFNTIECYKEVLNYYGHYINANYEILLDEYPYGFGFDDFAIKYTDEETIEQHHIDLCNPWRPNGNKE